MSPDKEKPKESNQETHMTALVDTCAGMGHFNDTDRQDTLKQQLDKEINGAPWHQDASQQALEGMEKHVKTVRPAYEGFWLQNDRNIPNRLNETAKKLKDRHAEMKQDITEGAYQQKDQVTPSDKYVTCNHLIGHHLLECSKNTLQHELAEVIHQIPVESLTGPPEIVHPFPVTRPQTLLMPPPSVLANFTVKLNKVVKIKTGPTSNEAKMVAAMTDDDMKIVTRRDPVS